jgi:hypothetical protein
MDLRFPFILWSLVAVSTITQAQDDQPENELVLYDPLFWKEQLKLDDDQCQKIREINGEFYERLSEVGQDAPNHQEARALAQETIIQRSEGIWETFDPKQRKRWKKIWQEKDRT